MKKTIKLAAVAIAAVALTAACNNAPAEQELDTLPEIDTTVVEELIDTTPVVDTPEVVAPVPAPKKAAAKKSAVQKVAEDVQTVKKVTLQTKKDIDEVKGELKEGTGNTANTKSLDPNSKPKASDAFKKN